MVKWSRRAPSSISFNSYRLRVAVLLTIISSLGLNVTLGRTASALPLDTKYSEASLSSAEASDFIIGPQTSISGSWFDTTELDRARIHGEACPTTPPTDPAALNGFNLLNYYDLPLSEYIIHARTQDVTFLNYARKCADSWWKHPEWIGEGRIRLWPDSASPPPRHAGIGGLILRALDGRPEMWDWINAYTRYHLDLWLKSRVNDPQLYIGVREGAFALHYATWLAKVLPDSFPLQAGGTETNGAGLRAQYLADIEAVSVAYFGRLQQADGSWRWNSSPDEYLDADGGSLVGIMQPFMVGLLLNALIDVHRVSNNATVKTNILNQIMKACRHLYADGPYRKDEPVVGLTGKRWRSFWYFYHGGTTVNPTKYQNGGGSYIDTTEGPWVVNSERQGISTIFSAYGYAYLMTGDSTFRDMGEELFDAAFGGSDGIRNLADGTAKNYNQNYRMGGRYLVWRGGGSFPTPTPTPTAASHLQLNSPVFNVFEGGGSAHLTVERTNPTDAASVDYRTSDTAGLVDCNLVNGVASARCDYTVEVGTLHFAPGESAKTISIPIVDDGYADGNENFSITLSNAIGATLGSPSVATITIQDKASNGTNPIDGTAFFVRQQYLDFLNREPDPGGYSAWQQIINDCQQGDTACDRIHVSSAFFRSPEFQDRGYFVYRFYPVAFGRKPDYAEFSPDLAKISVFLSATELNASKVAFIAEFMSRPAFVSKFNGLTDTQYVDTLLATAGVTSPNRDFWIAALGNGTRTRANVLREISESTEVYTRYYNQAFVVMQYFGYLRRDPDASYLDWINILNSSGDYRGMVSGFMNSLEYRSRLGP